jgi:hypothetical protein
MNRKHGDKEKPANLEDSRPKVEHGIIFYNTATPCVRSISANRALTAGMQYSRYKFDQLQNASDPQNPQDLDDSNYAVVTGRGTH